MADELRAPSSLCIVGSEVGCREGSLPIVNVVLTGASFEQN